MLWTKGAHQNANFHTACMKINQIPYVILQTTSQFPFKFCITLHYILHRHYLSETF